MKPPSLIFVASARCDCCSRSDIPFVMEAHDNMKGESCAGSFGLVWEPSLADVSNLSAATYRKLRNAFQAELKADDWQSDKFMQFLDKAAVLCGIIDDGKDNPQ